ncbi:hypothetical protein CP061683_0764A, partial [Chlamydia psittaci 06-1683]|jgi:hypothetical protein
MEQI